MNVAVYYPWVYLKGGSERTLLELMRRSRHSWTLYTNRYEPDSTFPEFRDLPVVELERVSVRRTVKDVGRAAFTLLTQRLPFQGADALMVASEGLGNLMALRTRHLPVFCLCLTPLRIAHDPFARERYFQAHPSRLTRMAVRTYAWADRLTWRRYERIFCISQEVASRVVNASLAPPDRIEVAHPGVDLHDFVYDRPQEPFFLLPGRIMWTKNIELGIDAFRQLRATVPEAERFRLVVAGMVDQKSVPYLQSLQERSKDVPGVEFVASPSDDELRDLYARCYAVLFTAFNEDWGLVPLEAMASGRPVVAVRRGGPIESVVDGETGFLCEPEADAFARAMTRLVTNPERAAAMGVAGRCQVARFPWSAFIDRIDDYVDRLVLRSVSEVERPRPAVSREAR